MGWINTKGIVCIHLLAEELALSFMSLLNLSVYWWTEHYLYTYIRKWIKKMSLFFVFWCFNPLLTLAFSLHLSHYFAFDVSKPSPVLMLHVNVIIFWDHVTFWVFLRPIVAALYFPFVCFQCVFCVNAENTQHIRGSHQCFLILSLIPAVKCRPTQHCLIEEELCFRFAVFTHKTATEKSLTEKTRGLAMSFTWSSILSWWLASVVTEMAQLSVKQEVVKGPHWL